MTLNTVNLCIVKCVYFIVIYFISDMCKSTEKVKYTKDNETDSDNRTLEEFLSGTRNK